MQHNIQSTRNAMYWKGDKEDYMTKEKTLEIFYVHQKLEKEVLAKVARLRDDMIRDEYLVQNAFIADQILIRYGITA